MGELDNWTDAVGLRDLWTEAAVGRLEMRLAKEPLPTETRRRRRMRGVAACLCAATFGGFLTTGVIEWRARLVPDSRWPAAAMDASPSVLLIADRGR